MIAITLVLFLRKLISPVFLRAYKTIFDQIMYVCLIVALVLHHCCCGSSNWKEVMKGELVDFNSEIKLLQVNATMRASRDRGKINLFTHPNHEMTILTLSEGASSVYHSCAPDYHVRLI